MKLTSTQVADCLTQRLAQERQVQIFGLCVCFIHAKPQSRDENVDGRANVVQG